MQPLEGIRVLDMSGLAPGPFCTMVLGDLGADIVVIEATPGAGRRMGGPGGERAQAYDPLRRNKRSIGLNLKDPQAQETFMRLAENADVVIEGYRPGVVKRLGVDYDAVAKRNPRIVYCSLSGYGQTGPYSNLVGHDINYISLGGALGAMARQGERPLFPLNLVADFGGGGMLLALGLVCGILEARTSGTGQVVDAAMVDGTAVLSTLFHALRQAGLWSGEPGTNLLDSGAHFYEVYETADGGHVAVGALEPRFYAELLRLLELDPGEFPQWDRARWPELKRRFAEVFATRTRDEWARLLEPAEACATPVLALDEAPAHPHNAARGTFVDVDGRVQPAPAPRFSRTPGAISRPAPEPGGDTDQVLADWGITGLERLRRAGAIA